RVLSPGSPGPALRRGDAGPRVRAPRPGCRRFSTVSLSGRCVPRRRTVGGGRTAPPRGSHCSAAPDAVPLRVTRLCLQVWFQNRRAKWRRQEKLEVSSMKLQDSPILSFSRSPQAAPVGALGGSLPLETWLGPPVPGGAALQSLPAMGPPPPYQCGAAFVDKFPLDEGDPRNTSIAALRMKAKEHIQSIGKPWQTI
uniref:Retinal homeobox protein Rx n=1 Tax=Pavo cristatus TaxID=9049 RepID=A0A8C9LDX6_PAVCR